jgi:hypothetical protein
MQSQKKRQLNSVSKRMSTIKTMDTRKREKEENEEEENNEKFDNLAGMMSRKVTVFFCFKISVTKSDA